MTDRLCLQCGLRVSAGRDFCCGGCRFLHGLIARASGPGEEEQLELRWLTARLVLCALLAVIAMMFSLVLYAEDVFPSLAQGAGREAALAWRGLLRLFLFAVSLPIIFLLGLPMARELWGAESWRERSSDALILTGAAAAFLVSAHATFFDGPQVYYETAAVVLVLITLGRVLDVRARKRAARELSGLSALLPATAQCEDGEELPVDALEPGRAVLVAAGSAVPVDGRVLSGRSELREALITGEAAPRSAGPGDRVYAGSLNLSGALTVATEARAGERLVDRIEAKLREAQGRPGRYLRLVERLAAWFLPLVLAVALGSALLWWGRSGRLMDGVLAGLAALLIACPCALGLATPLTVWAGLSRCARRGLVLRSAAALEVLGAAGLLLLDKTGTLTDGNLGLAAETAPSEEGAALARGLARRSRHPAARALSEALGPGAAAEIFEVEEQAGLGVAGRDAAGRALKLGNGVFVGVEDAEGRLYLSIEGVLEGAWRQVDRPRKNARPAVDALKTMGLELAVLTGDRGPRAEALARELGCAVEAECRPEDKLARVEAAQREGKVVVMVGDGLNDAPALAAADVGLAMDSALDLSREAADGTILADNLDALVDALVIARDVRRRVRWNLAWAGMYNVAGLSLAVSGNLKPVWAALGMVLSSALMITTSLSGSHGRQSQADPIEGPVPQDAPLPLAASPR